MFWGLIMEPNKRYTQEVEKSFHVSQAALDISSSGGEPVQVMVTFEKRNYLIATLQKGKNVQVPLDLNFETGNVISFTSNGESHVHLTGYLVPDDPYDDIMDNEDESVEEAPELVPSKKEKKKRSKNETPAKKIETTELADLLNNTKDDDTSSDDEDFDPSNITTAEESEDFDSDECNEKLADSSDDENEDQEEEEEEEEEEDEDEESEETEVEEEEEDTAEKNRKATRSMKDKKTPNTTVVQNGAPVQNNKSTVKPKLGKKTVVSGVVVEDMKIGNGQQALKGKTAQVYYVGRLKSNNKIFDSAQKGSGFKFAVGKGEVIKGWDVGVVGMHVGGKRKITIPPQMAYGAKGSPPEIPPNSTLIFEIELRNVH